VERSSDVNLVVMSDVIYAPALHGVLFATLRDIAMVFPAAVFIMSVEARRQEERGFFDLLRESGWGYRKVKDRAAAVAGARLTGRARGRCGACRCPRASFRCIRQGGTWPSSTSLRARHGDRVGSVARGRGQQKQTQQNLCLFAAGSTSMQC
jgi:hypothetical protein